MYGIDFLSLLPPPPPPPKKKKKKEKEAKLNIEDRIVII